MDATGFRAARYEEEKVPPIGKELRETNDFSACGDSNRVTAVGSPPPAGMRRIGPPGFADKMIVPSSFHAAPESRWSRTSRSVSIRRRHPPLELGVRKEPDGSAVGRPERKVMRPRFLRSRRAGRTNPANAATIETGLRTSPRRRSSSIRRNRQRRVPGRRRVDLEPDLGAGGRCDGEPVQPSTPAISATSARADAHASLFPSCPAAGPRRRSLSDVDRLGILDFKTRVADVTEPPLLILLQAPTQQTPDAVRRLSRQPTASPVRSSRHWRESRSPCRPQTRDAGQHLVQHAPERPHVGRAIRPPCPLACSGDM